MTNPTPDPQEGVTKQWVIDQVESAKRSIESGPQWLKDAAKHDFSARRTDPQEGAPLPSDRCQHWSEHFGGCFIRYDGHGALNISHNFVPAAATAGSGAPSAEEAARAILTTFDKVGYGYIPRKEFEALRAALRAEGTRPAPPAEPDGSLRWETVVEFHRGNLDDAGRMLVAFCNEVSRLRAQGADAEKEARLQDEKVKALVEAAFNVQLRFPNGWGWGDRYEARAEPLREVVENMRHALDALQEKS